MLLRRMGVLVLAALCLCTLSLSSLAFPQPAFAAGDPITVTSQTDTIHFPDYIDFDLSATDSSSPISQAIISITFGTSGYGSQEIDHTLNVNQGQPQGSTPSHTTALAPTILRSVTLHWREDTSGNNFYPAGVPVSYYWQLEDNAGHWHTDVTQHFTTIDSRFNWQHLSQDNLQVNWYNRPQDFGQMVFNKASASLAHISTVLGGTLLHPINLWIYQTDQDFHSSLPPNSYEWVGGEALPALQEAVIVVVDTSDTTLVRDMPHELTHLVFHQLIEGGVEVPTWFDEGLAVYNQLYHEPDMTARLQAALDAHALLRLDDITQGFPSNSDQAYLAYAQSWNLVSYMYSSFGLSKMALLIKTLNNPQTTFGQDLQQALGEDQALLENQWRIHLHQPPTLTPDQFTPTPTARHLLNQAATQTNADSSSALLIMLGFLLITLSLVMLLLINIHVTRRRQGRPQGSPLLYTSEPILGRPQGLPLLYTTEMPIPGRPAATNAYTDQLDYPDEE